MIPRERQISFLVLLGTLLFAYIGTLCFEWNIMFFVHMGWSPKAFVQVSFVVQHF